MAHYDELEIYEGDHTNCGNCKRKFNAGEVVCVDTFNNLVFCYSDASVSGCSTIYCFSSGKTVNNNAMRFGPIFVLGQNDRYPNNKNMPLTSHDDNQIKEEVIDDDYWPDVIGEVEL